MKEKQKPIIIEIHGGIPYVMENPEDKEILLRDYDIEGIPDKQLQTAPDGEKYLIW